MLWLWNFFLERRQFTYLLIIASVAAGITALIAIPKESAPEVDVPIAIVTTVLNGGSAEDVAKLVTKEIEKEVATVDNIDTLSSSSREGVSSVVVEFDASANLEKSVQDVKDAVDRAKPSLPRDAEEPSVAQVNFSEQPVLIISLSGGVPAAEFTRLAEKAKDELELVPGVSRVEVLGARDREVEVVVERETLASFGLSLPEVVSAISAANASLPVGTITVDGIEYAIAFKGELTDPEELSGVVVGGANGRLVYLRDVAEIVNGIERPRSIARVSIGGAPAEPAVTLLVYKKPGGNIITTTDAVEKRLRELSESTLAGLTPLTVFSDGDEVKDDLTELSRVGLGTITLVMLTLFLTIGWREAVIAGLSVPLSLVIAFVGLYASGNTVNFVSLFSLILAVGILVDSGIVVTEAVHTRYKKFGDTTIAAKEALREYATPLIAGTLTTVAVFVPLFFISGITGEFISSIPFTIIFVLVASIFVSLGFVPLIAILLTKRDMNKFEEVQERWNARFQAWYRNLLTEILGNRPFQTWFLRGIWVTLAITLLFPVTGLVKVIFFSSDDFDLTYIEIEEKQGTPLERTDLAARAVEELLYDDARIESFTTSVGASSAFSEGMLGGGSSGAKLANISVNLVPKEKRRETSAEVVEELRAAFAPFRNFSVRIFQPENGPPTGAPVLITFSGESLDDLERSVALGERVLQTISGAVEITTSTKDDGIEFSLTIDRAKAAEVGLSPAGVAGILRTAVSGTVATTIIKDDEDIDVLVSANLNPSWSDPSELTDTTIESLTNLSVATPKGEVLLGSLLSASVEKSNAVINREDQKNIATISSQVAGGRTAAEVSAAFKSAMKSEKIPPGVSMKVGGEIEDVDQSFREMFVALIAGMVLMLGILVLEFNSFRYSGYLLSLVPLSLIGVLTGLLLTGQPVSFPSLLGVIALSGVIINNGIILVDSFIARANSASGMTLADIVVDASASRLRPIILTTVTTVIGMIPLASASALWGPLAFSIIFGLTFGTVLTLIILPILLYRNPGKEYGQQPVSNKTP